MPGPGLRYRSARDLGADPAVDPFLLLTEALALREKPGFAQDDRDRARRMLIGLAQRPDLPGHVLTRFCEALDGNHEWLPVLALLRNPAYRKTEAVRDLLTGDLLPALVQHADEFAEDLLRLLPHNTDVAKAGYRGHPLIGEIRDALGEDRINALFDAWLVRGGDHLYDLVHNPLLTDHGWAAALERLGQANGTAPTSDELSLLGLSSAPTLTAERALALIDVYDAIGAKPWNHLGILRNRYCPPEVYERLVVHKDHYIAHATLADERCPDSARFIAAAKGRPLGLLNARTTIAPDLAHKVLDDLDRGRAGRRKIRPKDAAKIRDAIAQLTTDQDVTARLLATYLSAADTPAKGVAAFFFAATAQASPWRLSGETRTDDVLRLLATSSEPAVRAFVVPFLGHGDDVLIAAADPASEVRLAAARHPLISAAALTLLVEDPDEHIRAVVTERFLAAMSEPGPLPAR